jgi:hypothetical protein
MNLLRTSIANGVPFEILKEYEVVLVSYYIDHLNFAGVIGYSFDECWRYYRRV